MSEPVTIWVRLVDEATDRVFYRMPERASYVISEQQVDWLRGAKHLTESESSAMYWASHGADTMGEGTLHWAVLSRRLTLLRFATNEQAV